MDYTPALPHLPRPENAWIFPYSKQRYACALPSPCPKSRFFKCLLILVLVPVERAAFSEPPSRPWSPADGPPPLGLESSLLKRNHPIIPPSRKRRGRGRQCKRFLALLVNRESEMGAEAKKKPQWLTRVPSSGCWCAGCGFFKAMASFLFTQSWVGEGRTQGDGHPCAVCDNWCLYLLSVVRHPQTKLQERPLTESEAGISLLAAFAERGFSICSQ